MFHHDCDIVVIFSKMSENLRCNFSWLEFVFKQPKRKHCHNSALASKMVQIGAKKNYLRMRLSEL